MCHEIVEIFAFAIASRAFAIVATALFYAARG